MYIIIYHIIAEIKRKPSQQQGIDPKQLAATLEGIEEDESPCMSHSSSQHDYNTASASSGCSSPLSEPTSTSSDQKRNKRVVATATASVSSPTPFQKRTKPKSTNNQGRYGSQGHLQTGSPDHAFKMTQSTSEYMNRSDNEPRPHTPNTPNKKPRPPPRNKSASSLEPPSPRAITPTHARTSPKLNERQNSEKLEPKKAKEPLNQQSNSFDDFIRMSHHAGVDDRQMSPSKKPSKRGLSVSATELAKRKGSESEDEIKKVCNDLSISFCILITLFLHYQFL